MGNQLTQPQRVQHDHLAEVPDVVLKESLGGGRFLKTLLCVHDEGGQVVVKVYNRRGAVDIEQYAQQLVHTRSRLSDLPCSHVWPFQHFFYTEKAAYLLRQYIFSNLYHRLSTRPFLAKIEKCWIAFQLLHGVAQSHEQGICHGDIKCENVLLTSWHWIYLTDFASYKPTYLPADNPADFSFFFDTGGRRRCYVAPERFYDPEAADDFRAARSSLQASMDIFSLGCVIAELFLDGQRLFDLSELLAYKRGEYSPEHTLAKVDAPFDGLVRHMINVEPGERSSAAEYLEQWGPSLFPQYFGSLLHPFFYSLLQMDSDDRIRAVEREYHILCHAIQGLNSESSQPRKAISLPDAASDIGWDNGSAMVQCDSRSKVGNLMAEADSLMKSLRDDSMRSGTPSSSPKGTDAVDQQKPVALEDTFEYQCRDRGRAFGEASTSGRLKALQEWKPPPMHPREEIGLEAGWQWTDDWTVDREAPSDSSGWAYLSSSKWVSKCTLDCLWRRRRWTRQRRRLQPAKHIAYGASQSEVTLLDGQGMVILATLLCSTMRGARLQEQKVQAIALLTRTAQYCDDDVRLQRVIPYLMECLKVPLASVRHHALRSLVQVLSCVTSLPPSDCNVFPEYILPSLSLVPHDKEVWVRSTYAAAIGPLADCAHSLLVALYAASQAQFESAAQNVRLSVEQVISEVVNGPRSNARIRRNLLSAIETLSKFLGQRESNDFLMPMLMTFLNSTDWQLRADFFTSIWCLRQHAGVAGIEAYLLPCFLQALGDQCKEVIAQALRFLASITAGGHLRRSTLIGILTSKRDVLPRMLLHNCVAVRASAVAFVTAAAHYLDKSGAYVFVRPVISSALVHEPADISSIADLLGALSTTIPVAQKRNRAQKGQQPHQEVPVYSVKLPAEVSLSMPLFDAAISDAPAGASQGAQRLLANARRLPFRATAALDIGSDETALSFQENASPLRGAINAAIQTKLPTTASWQPRGLLVAHLAEHRKAVNCIEVAGNAAFFATASDDSTVKIWDSRRLEKDAVFRSRVTHSSQSGRILACTTCDDGQSMATGSSDGSLHVWRVEYSTRPGGSPDSYTGITGKFQVDPCEGEIFEIVRWNSLLVYSTQHGRLHGCDLRSGKDVWGAMKASVVQGCWTCLAIDESCYWLVSGSSTGMLRLWDLRFQVCINEWQHGPRINAIAPASALPRRLGLPRLGVTCPLVYTTAGNSRDICLWDVEHGRCHQTLQSAPTVEHTALLPTPAGPLLSGSSDGCIRYWDASSVEQSYIVCAPPYVDGQLAQAYQSSGSVRYGQRLAGAQHHVVEEVSPGSSGGFDSLDASRRLVAAHSDAILAMQSLHSSGEKYLLSASADGIVKAWR